MATAAPPSRATHNVFNQVPPLAGFDLFSTNLPLLEATEREGAAWIMERARAVGQLYGGEPLEWGRLANENPPRLRTHDRFGNRIDEVEFHPAWHELLRLGVESEVHSLPWTSDEPTRHTARAALFSCVMQAEAGVCCPLSMTFAAIPALRMEPELAAEWEPRLMANHYDGRLRPAAEKGSALCGMAMTEKQGGSDVRANTTSARPLGGGEWELTGHKWFCSAPMCDVFLVLAQTDEGLSCFLVPRILPDGARNPFNLQRLKDKLGNRSNASSEVEFNGTWARMVGEPGRGVPTIIEMVGHTRLDCALGSAAAMARGVASATHHAAHRSAFGKLLIGQPLMQNVLADLAIEAEAATALAMRLARAFDDANSDGADGGDAQLFKRLATAVGKYWVCKRGPAHAAEALECHGGNGYVEESGMPRLYREIPLASIWEGSGNVMCLDVLRAIARTPRALETYLDECDLARGGDPRLDAHLDGVRAEFTDPAGLETRARRIVERMALGLQGSLLVRHAPPAVADAFCASRLAGDAGHEYGTLPADTDFQTIIARSQPQIG